MAKCTYCGSETELFNGGVPVCVKCAEEREVKRKPPASTQIRDTLLQAFIEANARANEASRTFDQVMCHFPSGLPHPDGVQRIKNASNELSIARKEMLTAHNRLNDYLGRGIVPEDLKRSG